MEGSALSAFQEFDLPTGAHLGEEGSITAVWDGSQFIIDDLGESWWSSAKLFWRYGYSPVTTRSLVNDLKNKFLQLYDSKWLHPRKNHNETTSGFPWKSIEQMASKLDFDDALGTTAQTWFYGKGVSQLFIQELIEAATRVNYGQNTDSIHALGGGVSLAASGATGVRGGNFRIFEEMIMRSNARVHFGEQGEVTGIVKFKSMDEAFAAGKISAEEYQVASQSTTASSPKWWIGTAAGTGGLYDAVLIGAPWHTSGITLVNTETVIPVNPYVHLYVTVLATNASHPNPVYFGRTKGSDVPTTILTSYEAVRKQNNKQQQQQGKTISSKAQHSRWWQLWPRKISNTAKQVQLDFTSLSYMSKLPSRPESQSAEHLVKIFSLSHLSDDQLDEIMGPNTTSWIYRQEWDAYPELVPTSEFPAIQPDGGLYYINALEMMISTMETSTVASRNVVAGLLEKWHGLDFVVGGKECEFSEQDGADRRPGWDGWGCNAA